MAFYPDRFDEAFVAMLDRFHETYPDVGLHIVVHFEHPDEFLAKDADGKYIQNDKGFLQWVPATGAAMQRLVSRGWLSVENQTPIMKGINDDPDALRILQREFKRAGGENHYFFCGRDIIAYRAFNAPIETVWKILNESQKGLSGVESHARLSITHYKGKTEVCAVTNEPIPGLKGSENGVVIFKIMRNSDEPLLARYEAFAEKFLYKCAEAEDAGKRIKWNVIKNAFSDAVRTETVLKHWMQEV